MLCKIHTTLLAALLIAGFTLLYIVLIVIGKKTVGIIGIVLLYLMPVWRLAIEYAERTGKLTSELASEVPMELAQAEITPKA